MAYFRDQMWSILFASLLTVLLMWIVYIVMGMVHKLVITPLRIKRIMNRQGVKGPSAYWVLGNILEMVKINRAEAEKDMKTGDYDIMSHVQPYEAQNCQAYGTMHMWWFGWQATIRIASLDLIKQVLAKDVFTTPQIQFQFLSELLGKGLITTEGEEWALHRQIVNPAFHQEKLKAMVPIMEKCASSMANEWEEKVKHGGGCVELEVSHYMANVTADIIAHTAFGSSYEKGRKVFEHQLSLFNLTFQRFKFLTIPGYRSLKEIIQARKYVVNMTKNASNGNDLLGLMLTATSQKTQDVKGGKVHFGMQQLMDNCKTFFFAGYETTATLLTWTMMLLASHTTWQECARAEVIDVCGDGDHPFNADMLDKLKMLTMILNEALRLFPPVVDQTKEVVMDVKLGDLDIPKGSTLYFPRLSIHHDPELWGTDVHEFKPERFVNGVAKATKHPLAFMPFSFGPRFCVGQRFAMEEAKSILVVILRRFRFQLSSNYRHAPCFRGTLKPKYGVSVMLESL
ncbi:hypothetical protein CY35_U001800 [Sphagnum magellanicum]|uniref:Cytochrome P450 n=1 Tax=Sphagnum magellanicum TaxID=128215 RepID=A0AAD4QDH6_9BRYO|nr:hypothetical protein CY35_U001800 [Sphagnum magellanicum]